MADTFASFGAKLGGFTSKLPQDMNDVAESAAEVVASEARRRVPVRSGRLRGGIVSRKSGAGGVAAVEGVVYAGVIHNGWPAHNIRANPFLTDAAAATERDVAKKVDKAVDAAIRKAGL